MTARIVVAGVHGYGRQHVDNVRRLADRGVAQLVGVCDPRPVETVDGAAWFPTLTEALSRAKPDVCVIATPLHTHVDLAVEALNAGCDVLLEKPPAATWAGFQRLRETAVTTGRRCQVGFQSLASAAIPALHQRLRDGAFGELRAVGAAGSWSRDSRYYGRAAWAGRRVMDGQPVVDGALTNPFAHAVVTALDLAGATDEHDVAELDLELYRANPIEADDTSCVRIRTRDGVPVTVAVSLCAAEETEPWIEVVGSLGSARLHYTANRVRWQLDGRVWTETYDPGDLLDDLLQGGQLVPLARTAAFMRVLEAVRTAPDPQPIDPMYTVTEARDGVERRIIPGIAGDVVAAARSGRTFRELGTAWAT
jgi:predicted dehydrogenase